MSDWREREFAHESDAYYRSLDQAFQGPVGESIAGYHVEAGGRNVCDWMKIEGKRVEFTYGHPNGYALVEFDSRKYLVRFETTLQLIRIARGLVLDPP
jgi:hypothetical protein